MIGIPYIFTYQKLSEEFSWINISQYQKLSEEFIEEHSDKLDWNCISLYQRISKDFILKHSDKFSLNYLSHDIEFNEDKIYNICTKRYNICIKCNCSDYNLHDMSCNEAIMDRVLK